MYAIVEIAGQQFKVQKDQKVFVHRLPGKEGDKVSFDNVLLTDNDNDVTIGAPAIKDASVEAEITRHLKGDKVIVFKKKRRKGYRKKNGHRQALSEIVINEITLNGAKKTEDKKTAEPKKKKTASKTKKADNLTKILGLGPKSAEALKEKGISTFKKLSETSPEDIQKILSEASDRLAHIDPKTWPKQAELAAEGKFDELDKWQEELDNGEKN